MKKAKRSVWSSPILDSRIESYDTTSFAKKSKSINK